MGPFAALGLEEGYAIDRAALKKRLLSLSRLTHPDYFAAASDEDKEKAEVASAQLNEAYRLLGDDFSRADHLVRHLGGPSESDERQMPQAFLMEVLEWNETLEEGREAAADSPERARLESLASELESQREDTMSQVAAGLTPLPEAGSPPLTELRRHLNAVRYIDRALREIRELHLSGAG